MEMKTALAALDNVFGAFSAEHRIASEELDKAERRLGIVLPQALRTMYERTGRHPFHTSQNYLVEPSKLGFHGEHLVIYEENQGVCLWGIARSALSSADPPVDMGPNDDTAKFEAEFVSVTHFLLCQAALQATGILPFSALILPPMPMGGRMTAPQRSISREQAAIVGEPLWSDTKQEIRSRSGAISFVAGHGDFSLACRDELTFRDIADALGIDDDDWDYFSPRDG